MFCLLKLSIQSMHCVVIPEQDCSIGAVCSWSLTSFSFCRTTSGYCVSALVSVTDRGVRVLAHHYVCILLT